MLTMNGKKMAKSTGNNILPAEIFSGDNRNISKGYSAGVARFFMMQAHYRSILDFSDEAISASEKGFNRLMEALGLLEEIQASEASTVDVESWIQKCYEALNDDFNTPVLIAHLFEAVKWIHLAKTGKENLSETDLKELKSRLHVFVYDILGLVHSKADGNNDQRLDGLIKMLIGVRNEARANRDWALSDQIRDQLAVLGVNLKDGKEGTSYTLDS
jgi:cysteinyl-tRNA synthetase